MNVAGVSWRNNGASRRFCVKKLRSRRAWQRFCPPICRFCPPICRFCLLFRWCALHECTRVRSSNAHVCAGRMHTCAQDVCTPTTPKKKMTSSEKIMLPRRERTKIFCRGKKALTEAAVECRLNLVYMLLKHHQSQGYKHELLLHSFFSHSNVYYCCPVNVLKSLNNH